MNARTQRLTANLYNGYMTAESQGLCNQYIPIQWRPQLKQLVIDIYANTAESIPDFQLLLKRCYDKSLYDGPHPLYHDRIERRLYAEAVIEQAKNKGFTYNERSRSFR